MENEISAYLATGRMGSGAKGFHRRDMGFEILCLEVENCHFGSQRDEFSLKEK
jgi:hypothetical protein